MPGWQTWQAYIMRSLQNTDASAFLHILITQRECLFTPVSVLTPPETSVTTDHSNLEHEDPQPMDVDTADEFPEGVEI